MTVRRAAKADIDAIRRVAETAWTADYPDILTRETAAEGVEQWYGTDRIAGELDEPETELLVAEHESSVAGFAHATYNESDAVGYILRLYVEPGHRGDGVGRELFERTREALADHDIARIHAMVLAENEPGNEFYRRFGLELTGESETQIGGDRYREHRYTVEL